MGLCLAVFSASECSWEAGKGKCPNASVPPEGFYSGPAAGMGSETSEKENQGLSKEKGVAWKELNGNLYLSRQQSLPRNICKEKCERGAFGHEPGWLGIPNCSLGWGSALALQWCFWQFGLQQFPAPLSWSGQHIWRKSCLCSRVFWKLELKHIVLNGNWINCSVDVWRQTCEQLWRSLSVWGECRFRYEIQRINVESWTNYFFFI